MHLPVGKRTSLIVDPPDGRIPPFTPEAQQARDALRQFQLALLQPTAACKERHPGCAGGRSGPCQPRRREMPPTYLSGAGIGINRADGPEDRNQGERCIGAALPHFGNFIGGFSRIVQAQGEVSIFYEIGTGTGRLRSIPITTAPAPALDHPPILGRLPRSLGGQHAGCGRDEFLAEVKFPGSA